jgi:hypothetical protein
MEKKFTKKYYQLGLNHFQVHVSEDMFLQVKLSYLLKKKQ